HVLLFGDSHAGMMIPTFVALAKQHDLTLSIAIRGGCPWQQDLYVPPLAVSGQPIRQEDCKAQRDDIYDRVIPALHPDIIVVMNLAYETPNQKVQYRAADQKSLKIGSPELNALLDRTTRASVDRLGADARKVVILEPVPYDPANFDSLACLSQAAVVAECRYTVDPGPSGLERLYRRIDKEADHVWSLDLDRLVCPYLPICDPIVNGLVARIDGSHLNRTFARSLGPSVGTIFEDNGILR
ncbi:MAG: SGNH hydrolase domain-containing protein, partial [Microthrixaceae bacterium]